MKCTRSRLNLMPQLRYSLFHLIFWILNTFFSCVTSLVGILLVGLGLKASEQDMWIYDEMTIQMFKIKANHYVKEYWHKHEAQNSKDVTAPQDLVGELDCQKKALQAEVDAEKKNEVTAKEQAKILAHKLKSKSCSCSCDCLISTFVLQESHKRVKVSSRI